MSKIKLTKIFTFEMGHALMGYDGDCRNIHGHSYQLHVTVEGTPRQEEGHPKDGMVIDFGDLKNIVKPLIVDRFDHALVLNERTPAEAVGAIREISDKVVLTPFQPTCENLLLHMVETIKAALPEHVGLHSVRLYETATSYATWERNEQN